MLSYNPSKLRSLANGASIDKRIKNLTSLRTKLLDHFDLESATSRAEPSEPPSEPPSLRKTTSL